MKLFIFGILLTVMALPAIQHEFGIMPVKPLKGAVAYAEKPEFLWNEWLTGEFQADYDQYLEDHIGFRPFFVRLYNQVDFSMFGEIHARGVVLGKEGYLYERSYIEAYTGRDYIGDDQLKRKAGFTSILQDTLRKAGTLLLPVFIPGKASFFPEYIPDDLLEPKGPKTNEEALKSAFDSLGVEYLDLSSWYYSMKSSSEYPLYPKCGIHWSDHGVSLVLDTLIRYLESSAGKEMVSFHIPAYDHPDTLRYDDYDIAAGMNLLFKMDYYPMAYPNYKFIEGPDKFMPAVMTLADSYYWRLFATGLVNRFFSRNSFRYYNNRIFELEDLNSYPVDHSNWFRQAEEFDFILIMFTEANLKSYAYDFLENGHLELISDEQVLSIMEAMRQSEEWMDQIRKKAGERNITVQEMMRIDALWMIQEEEKKKNDQNKR